MGRVGGGGGGILRSLPFQGPCNGYCPPKNHYVPHRAIKTTGTGTSTVKPSRHARQRSSPHPGLPHTSPFFSLWCHNKAFNCLLYAHCLESKRFKILYLTTCSSSLDSGFRDCMSSNMVNLTLEGVLLQQINKTNNK
jgi:hypothetical protein